jgi:hypothetical protein
LVNGERDRVVPSAAVAELAAKTKTQRGIKLEHEIIPGANHFFEGEDKIAALKEVVGKYIDRRLAEILRAKAEEK